MLACAFEVVILYLHSNNYRTAILQENNDCASDGDVVVVWLAVAHQRGRQLYFYILFGNKKEKERKKRSI